MIIAPEEHGHNTGACMSADDRADGGNVDFCFRETLSNHIAKFLCYLQAVTVTDDDLFGDLRHPTLFHVGKQCLQCLFLASGLAHSHQLAVIVHMNQGLDPKQRSHGGRGSADAATVLQVVKGIHCDPMAQIQAVCFQPVVQFLNVHALRLLSGSLHDEQALANSSTEGVKTQMVRSGYSS